MQGLAVTSGEMWLAPPVEPPSPRPPVALYLHFPFCLSVCPYCDFVVYTGRAARGSANRVGQLVDALLVELELRAAASRARFGRASPLASVYLGGGTPSLMSPVHVERLLAAIVAGFGMQADAEVSLEANPGPAERGDLAGFRAAGVNRLSIGAQSLEAGELRRLGRRHTPTDVGDTVRLARRAGFANVSLDLLYDVPGQTPAAWRRTLRLALSLEPDHLSAYALTLEDPDGDGLAGPLGDHLPLRAGARRWRDRARAAQDADRAAQCYELADRLFEDAGLRWYELSNWARPGADSRHNGAYWLGLPYEGVGPGAHAFDGAYLRRWNAARLDAYLAALADSTLPPGAGEVLDPPGSAAELAILRLRTRAGLPASLAGAPAFRSALAWARAKGLLEATDDEGVRLTLAGRLLANELFVRLLPDVAQRQPADAA
jgi:putative oxygen-independent coproporphyrinogen III oxidase